MSDVSRFKVFLSKVDNHPATEDDYFLFLLIRRVYCRVY